MKKVSHAEFLGLAYHSLFGYPLTEEELSFWQIGRQSYPQHRVERTGPFLFLPGERELVAKRVLKTGPSEKKWEVAKKAARILSKLPTIKFVGVTGALSMGAAGEEDDIDLLIITAVDNLWITRLLSYLILAAKGIAVRRASDKKAKDKLCLNLWLDEKHLSFEQHQDVYTAHEILQIKPLFTRGATYRRLLEENSWLGEFFPNAQGELLKNAYNLESRSSENLFVSLSQLVLRTADFPAYLLQKWYMKKKRTREIIEPGRALFHPRDLQSFAPKAFLLRLEQLAKGKGRAHFSQMSE